MNKLFSSNISVRIVSVLIAIVIWFVASDQSISQSTSQEMSKNFYRIPIEAINIPSNFSVSYDYISIESVVLKGNASLLSSMLGQEITASIDLEGLTEGEFDLPIQLRYPAGLSLVAVQPPRVHVALISSVSRVMDIEVVTTGVAQVANAIPILSYKPESILVEGPRTSLEKVTRAVVSVDLTGKTGNFEQAMDVKVMNVSGAIVTDVVVQPSLISVTVLFQPLKQVTLKLPEDLLIPAGWVLSFHEITPSTVEIYGNQTDIDKIQNLFLKMSELVISSEEASGSKIEKTLKASIVIPQGSLISVKQGEVEVILRLEKGNPG
jgi:YbbR domain-containing protein